MSNVIYNVVPSSVPFSGKFSPVPSLFATTFMLLICGLGPVFDGSPIKFPSLSMLIVYPSFSMSYPSSVSVTASISPSVTFLSKKSFSVPVPVYFSIPHSPIIRLILSFTLAIFVLFDASPAFVIIPLFPITKLMR